MSLPKTIYAREFGDGRRMWRPPTDQPWSDETVFVQKVEADELRRQRDDLLALVTMTEEALRVSLADDVDIRHWDRRNEPDFELSDEFGETLRSGYEPEWLGDRLRAAIAKCGGG